jgi:NAD(P)-dependent dehydrogenase (short-subunit alcohol dehydrogenase family)
LVFRVLFNPNSFTVQKKVSPTNLELSKTIQSIEGNMELFDLTGKVAVVIGGSRGIGMAIAEGLASCGAQCVIAARDLGRAEEAAEGIRKKNYSATAISVDVADRKSVENLAAQTLRKFQKIDILVNSAAMILRKPIEEVTDEEWNAILATNLSGIFISCQVVGRDMIKRRKGKIINISSNVAQVLQPGRGAYAVTKAAVSHLTRVFAFEWAQYNINVNAVAPGPTLTEFNQKYFDEHPEDLKARIQSMPLARMGQPRDHVGAAILLASSASDFITGQTIFVDGGSILQ